MPSAAKPGLTGRGLKPAAERLYGRTRGAALRNRQQVLLDQALPRLRFNVSAHGADPLAAFSVRPDELWLEVGFGGGEHARALAAEQPQAGLIACEIYAQGLCSMLSALVPAGAEATARPPANLLLWDDDARILLQALPPSSLSRLFLMFPDPWPKARHAKRRFVHPDNLRLAARALRPGATWRIATDDPTYQAWTEEVFAASELFAGNPPAEARPHGWPLTRYEAKALIAGRRPLYWTFTRTDRPA